MSTPGPLDYELIDFGRGRRLERFGRFVLDRPDAAATGPQAMTEGWAAADGRFERDRGRVECGS